MFVAFATNKTIPILFAITEPNRNTLKNHVAGAFVTLMALIPFDVSRYRFICLCQRQLCYNPLYRAVVQMYDGFVDDLERRNIEHRFVANGVIATKADLLCCCNGQNVVFWEEHWMWPVRMYNTFVQRIKMEEHWIWQVSIARRHDMLLSECCKEEHWIWHHRHVAVSKTTSTTVQEGTMGRNIGNGGHLRSQYIETGSMLTQWTYSVKFTTNAIERNIGDGTSNPLQVKPDRRRSNVRQTNESSKTDRTNDRNTAQLKFFFVFFALVTTNKLMFNTI
uniref:G protein-coupled receptor n=1 Tax=Panagrellus redivivus TaxID=6233 RepID=A0A7E4W4M5_PANRE